MPTIEQELGEYVVLKKRVGPTYRVLFQVPPKLRPSGWLPAIRLPLQGDWPGDLTDAAEVAAIQRDARALYEALRRQRAGVPVEAPARSLEALVLSWQASSAWKALKPKTVSHYETYINNVEAWSRASGYPDPTAITPARVEEFLALFDETPTTKKHTHKVLRLVMAQAIAKGWRVDNPCAGIKIKVPKSRVAIWEQADVDLYVSCARRTGVESIALMILLEWEIGQRLTDLRAFKLGGEYDAKRGVFSFEQSKTDEPVVIEISDALRELLNKASTDQLFLFRNERTGKAYTENRLSKTFGWVRNAAVKAGGRPLLLKWLRHSCIVQLARAGCNPVQIASITGHAIASVTKILSVYLPRDSKVARQAQEMRGIIRARAAS